MQFAPTSIMMAITDPAYIFNIVMHTNCQNAIKSSALRCIVTYRYQAAL